jgi:Ca2+/Na+ antiporter
VTTADRKFRNQRTTALTCGIMAEVLLGTTTLVWSGSPAAVAGAAFGRVGSIAVVGAGMIMLVAAMVVASVASHLSRGVLVTVVALFFLVFAGVAVTAVTILQSNPGVGFLLILGWLLAVPVALHIRRAI